MAYWNNPFVNWQPQLPEGWTLYLCQIRPGRIKARVPAVLEVMTLLTPFQPVPLLSGPLADQKGVFWIGLPKQHEAPAEARFKHLGYTRQVMKLTDARGAHAEPHDQPIIWRGKSGVLKTVYREDQEWFRNRAPDRRVFMMPAADGGMIPVRGYRGDGRNLSRRGLAPEDARLLVNLVMPHSLENIQFLDPFAGIGGLIIEAQDRGFRTWSGDIDPVVQHGLRHLGAKHCLMDAARMPFPDRFFHAIATEPPFHRDIEPVIRGLLREFDRILRPGGKIAVLVAEWEAVLLEQAAQEQRFNHLLTASIDRKGIDVCVCVWQKPV